MGKNGHLLKLGPKCERANPGGYEVRSPIEFVVVNLLMISGTYEKDLTMNGIYV
jgi:hypothetical protein